MLKSVVLLSAGLDSTVNFKKAFDEGVITTALTFDYGQRAAAMEAEMSAAICKRFGVDHRVIRLDWLADITQTALVDDAVELPSPSNLDDDAETRASAQAVWVPNRNGIFINIAGAFAESSGAAMVVAGFNAEEARTFPDNSPQFIAAANKFLSLSTLSRPKVVSFTSGMDKTQIVSLAREIGAPLEYAWPCYRGGRDLCRTCESCQRMFRALRKSGNLEWFESLRK